MTNAKSTGRWYDGYGIGDPTKCANLNSMAFASGAALSVSGLDRVFAGYGAPPAVHWALGGLGVEYYCNQKFSPDKDTAMAMAAAYGGGFVASMVLGR